MIKKQPIISPLERKNKDTKIITIVKQTVKHNSSICINYDIFTT